MRRFVTIARNPVAVALVAGLALAGCASKKTVPNSAADIMTKVSGFLPSGMPGDSMADQTALYWFTWPRTSRICLASLHLSTGSSAEQASVSCSVNL